MFWGRILELVLLERYGKIQKMDAEEQNNHLKLRYRNILHEEHRTRWAHLRYTPVV
jgi:hypothetical protein